MSTLKGVSWLVPDGQDELDCHSTERACEAAYILVCSSVATTVLNEILDVMEQKPSCHGTSKLRSLLAAFYGESVMESASHVAIFVAVERVREKESVRARRHESEGLSQLDSVDCVSALSNVRFVW